MSGTTMDKMILKRDTMYSGHSATYDLRYGGMSGHLPRIGLVGENGQMYAEWHANQAYLRQNIIPYLLKAPKFFDFLPNSSDWIKTYKSILETLPLTIDGFNSTISVETDSRPIGGGGQEQEEPINITRQNSTPSYTFKEIAGKAINKFFETYIYMAFGDEYTKKPNIANYLASIDEIGGLYGPEMYSGVMLFIEPDVTRKQVLESWLCINFWPKGAGEIIGKMDKKSGSEIQDVTIEFAAITLRTEAVRRLADLILANLTVLHKMPDLDLLLPIAGEHPDVKAVSSEVGYNAR